MEQSKAELKMKRMLLAGGKVDETSYQCELLRYDQKEECIYLVLSEAEPDCISLDAVYRCTLMRDGFGMKCEGQVTDRYTSQDGNILKFQIKKGFYKININSVDKEEV